MTPVIPGGWRVMVTAVGLAAAMAIGTWIVVDPPARPHVTTIDVALLAEAIAERHAAQTYSPVPVTQTLWTTIEHVPTGATNEVWGGYESVTVSATGIGLLAGTYHFAHRTRHEPNCTPDRGFADVYTNSSGRRLIDLGPVQGSAFPLTASPGGMRGGWVLREGTFLARDFSLPPGFHLQSGWFLCAVGSEYWATGRRPIPAWYAAINPATISIDLGPIDPLRTTYWTPTVPALRTNELTSLPTYSETWYGGNHADWTGGGAPLDVWTNINVTAPLIICHPQSAWVHGSLAAMISGLTGRYVDSARATTPPDDFDGQRDIPLLSGNTNFIARMASWQQWASLSTTTNLHYIFRSPPFVNLGQAILQAQSHICDHYWTNLFTSTYLSMPAKGDDFDDALSNAISSPNWYLDGTNYTPYAVDGGPGYTIWIDLIGPYPWGPDSEVSIGYRVRTGTLIARPGLGHGIQGHHSIQAHCVYGGSGHPPSGETIIPSGRAGEWFHLPRKTGTSTPEVTIVSPPTHTSAPDATMLGLLASDPDGTFGWSITNTVVIATPDFSVE